MATCKNTTLNLTAGQTVVIPAGAEVIFCSNSSAVQLAEDCSTTIPATPAIKCYTFAYGANDNNFNGDDCDRKWESFEYNGKYIAFDQNLTQLCAGNGNNNEDVLYLDYMAQTQADEIWGRIQADPDLKSLVLGLGVYAENYSDYGLYAIKIRMYDLGIGAPYMTVVDSNTKNMITGQPIRARMQGEEVDCQAYIGAGNGQVVKPRGDIFPTEPQNV